MRDEHDQIKLSEFGRRAYISNDRLPVTAQDLLTKYSFAGAPHRPVLPKNIQSQMGDFTLGAVRGWSAQPDTQETTAMKKTLLAVAAATSLAVSLLAAPPADARCYGCAVGAGIAAGVVAGAVVGSAIANSYGPAYVVQPGYVAYPAYAVGAPVGCPGGYWARRPVAFDAYGNPIGWSRPRYFCP